MHATYRNRADFEAAAGSWEVLLEDFDSFSNGELVTELFDGLVVFDAPFPSIFWGNWNGHGTAGEFSGGAIIPEPRFGGNPLTLNFSTPVFGIGGNAFDDFDGNHRP